MKFLVKITETERKIIQKENKRNRLAISSRSKNSGGKGYWIPNDDLKSLEIVAELRGYKSHSFKNKSGKTITISAIQKLLNS